MNFSKYKKSIIACILALSVGLGGGLLLFRQSCRRGSAYCTGADKADETVD